ncbi:MAG: hypothetical protein AUH15_00395 [Acidobacteriales bacterium 13_2_20CM_55_8]|nr:MAG: hypothetical protein AUH15_00395 [Acidobacteriales bacterium 13_2_20CM_55_8]
MAGKDTPDENAAHVKMQVLPVVYLAVDLKQESRPRINTGRLLNTAANRLLLIVPLAPGSMNVVVLNAGLNVIDRLLSEIQSLDAMPALVLIRFLQFFRGFPQMLKSCLHMRLVLSSVPVVLRVETSRSQRHQRNCEHYSEMG